ncbi:MAG: dephospho-CoA kinase [Planctomycetes bacterium]|nr:dephospho-CoA kinase [Planctomycetota bacterium]
MPPATDDAPLPPRSSFPNLRLIGVVGGVGSGKSRVARTLESLGARTLDADRIAHDVLASDEMRAELERLFAPTPITDPGGKVDRAAIAARVFEARRASGSEKPPLLAALERLIHPGVRRTVLARLAAWNAEGKPHVVALDVPLLVEKGWHLLCDAVVYVDASDDERLRRVVQTRGWTVEAWRAREGAQAPLELKRRLASTVVPNHDVGASGEDTDAEYTAILTGLYARLRTELDVPSSDRSGKGP